MAYINGKEVLFAPVNSGGSGSGDVVLQEEKTVEINANEEVEILPDAGYDAVKKVIANVNVESSGEDIPDHTETDFALHFSGREGAIGVIYSSTEKAAFEAAPEGKEIDSFVDTNFLAENIKKDKSIFGVVGTYEGEGGGGEQPQLYAPTLSLNGDALIITENASNGTFTKSYDLYIDGSFVGNYTITTIDLTTLGLADGDYTIAIRAKGTNFADSADSAIAYTVGATAGLYQDGVLVKTWADIKAEFPKAFETAGEINAVSNGMGGKVSAFNKSSGELRIDNEITIIGDGAFSSCSLTYVLPDSLVRIYNTAFMQNNSLTIITIPAAVQSIGTSAFRTCANLTTVRFKGTPNSLDAAIFTGSNNLTDIYVPWAEGAVANAPWSAKNATIHYNSEV